MAGGSADADLNQQLNILATIGVVGDQTDGRLVQRFLTAHDESRRALFTALVERHGPMVLRVCRQVLGDSHDADDAFQATFLILARKAGSVRKADSLASWLHGVALRVAARARADAIRRQVHERRVGPMNEAAPTREEWPELHEEIARLPERYREPVVLCYLEGLSTEAAAMRIGCPKGTVLSRLSRARERLRGRLVRRGVASSAVLTAAGSISEAATVALPAALIDSTVSTNLLKQIGFTTYAFAPSS